MVVCFFLGLGSLVSWNSMLTIGDYYYQLFPVSHAYFQYIFWGKRWLHKTAPFRYCTSTLIFWSKEDTAAFWNSMLILYEKGQAQLKLFFTYIWFIFYIIYALWKARKLKLGGRGKKKMILQPCVLCYNCWEPKNGVYLFLFYKIV